MDKAPLSQEEIDALLAAAVGAQEEQGLEPEARDTTKQVTAQPVEFESMEVRSQAHHGGAGAVPNVAMILDVPMEVTVELGRTRRRVREILSMTPGSVVELDRQAGEPVDILVNGKLLARGEVVVIDENFGVRISEVVSRAERLATLK